MKSTWDLRRLRDAMIRKCAGLHNHGESIRWAQYCALSIEAGDVEKAESSAVQAFHYGRLALREYGRL